MKATTLTTPKEKYQPKRLMTHQEYINYLMEQRMPVEDNTGIIYRGKRINNDGTRHRMTKSERRKFHISQAFDNLVSMLDKIMVIAVFIIVFTCVVTFSVTYTTNSGMLDFTAENAPVEGDALNATIDMENILDKSTSSVVDSANLAFESTKPQYESEDIVEEVVPEEPVIQEPEQIDIYDSISFYAYGALTGYDPYEDGDGMTASGVEATYNHTAAINGLKFGTKIYIPGVGVFYVEDRNSGGVSIATYGQEAIDALYDDSVPVYILTDRE